MRAEAKAGMLKAAFTITPAAKALLRQAVAEALDAPAGLFQRLVGRGVGNAEE
jgi:hypothetical protein